MKYLVIGHKDHGKDEVCKILRDTYGVTYRSSSMVCLEEFLYEKLRLKYRYTSMEECFLDRDNHRLEWRDEIRAFNIPKDKLSKIILAQADTYCGLRCHLEFAASKYLYDRIIWVNASNRLPVLDESLTIQFDPTCMVNLDNNGPESDLPRQVKIALSKNLVANPIG